MGMELVRKVWRPDVETIRARRGVQRELVIARDRVEGGYDLAHLAVIRTVGLDRHIASHLGVDQPFVEAELRTIQQTTGMGANLAILGYMTGK